MSGFGYLFVGGPSHAWLLEPSPAHLDDPAAPEWVRGLDCRYVLSPGDDRRWIGVYYHAALLDDETRGFWLKDAESIWENA